MDIVSLIKSDRAGGAQRLVAEYGNRLYETAIRLCGNTADAEDYAFRTLERAIARIESFKGSSSFFTWLYEILVNLIRSDKRRKAANALEFTDELPELVDPRPRPTEELIAQEEAEAVRASLAELPLPLREIIVFRYWEDLTVPEIAQILKIPEGTVKSRLFLAKNRVRASVSRTIESHHASNSKEES